MFLGFINFYQQFIQAFNQIAGPLKFILRTANSSEHLLISVNGAEEDEVVSRNRPRRRNKNLSKSPKPKILTVLSNIGVNVKTTQFLILEAYTAFI